METETIIPSQIKKETANPALRGGFQLLTRINRVNVLSSVVESYIRQVITHHNLYMLPTSK